MEGGREGGMVECSRVGRERKREGSSRGRKRIAR